MDDTKSLIRDFLELKYKIYLSGGISPITTSFYRYSRLARQILFLFALPDTKSNFDFLTSLSLRFPHSKTSNIFRIDKSQFGKIASTKQFAYGINYLQSGDFIEVKSIDIQTELIYNQLFRRSWRYFNEDENS